MYTSPTGAGAFLPNAQQPPQTAPQNPWQLYGQGAATGAFLPNVSQQPPAGVDPNSWYLYGASPYGPQQFAQQAAPDDLPVGEGGPAVVWPPPIEPPVIQPPDVAIAEPPPPIQIPPAGVAVQPLPPGGAPPPQPVPPVAKPAPKKPPPVPGRPINKPPPGWPGGPPPGFFWMPPMYMPGIDGGVDGGVSGPGPTGGAGAPPGASGPGAGAAIPPASGINVGIGTPYPGDPGATTPNGGNVNAPPSSNPYYGPTNPAYPIGGGPGPYPAAPITGLPGGSPTPISGYPPPSNTPGYPPSLGYPPDYGGGPQNPYLGTPGSPSLGSAPSNPMGDTSPYGTSPYSPYSYPTSSPDAGSTPSSIGTTNASPGTFDPNSTAVNAPDSSSPYGWSPYGYIPGGGDTYPMQGYGGLTLPGDYGAPTGPTGAAQTPNTTPNAPQVPLPAPPSLPGSSGPGAAPSLPTPGAPSTINAFPYAQPYSVFTPQQTAEQANLAVADSQRAANPYALAVQTMRPGTGLSAGNYAAVMPQVAQDLSQGALAQQQIPFQNALANQSNLLSGQILQNQGYNQLSSIGQNLQSLYNSALSQDYGMGLNNAQYGLGQQISQQTLLAQLAAGLLG